MFEKNVHTGSPPYSLLCWVHILPPHILRKVCPHCITCKEYWSQNCVQCKTWGCQTCSEQNYEFSWRHKAQTINHWDWLWRRQPQPEHCSISFQQAESDTLSFLTWTLFTYSHLQARHCPSATSNPRADTLHITPTWLGLHLQNVPLSTWFSPQPSPLNTC